MTFDFSLWDAVLIGVVTIQCLLIAYAESPKWKGLFLTLPLPFTAVVMSVGRPIDASTIAALFVLLVYTQSVRLLSNRLHVPIVLAIGTGVAIYAVIGLGCAKLVPTGDTPFWVACAVTIPTGLLLHSRHRKETEHPHRTTLPIALKLPAILAVLGLLLTLKHALAGFAPLFPLVSVVGAYETRHSLWTLARPVFTLMVAIPPMLIVTRLTQPSFGLGGGLALGWVVFLPILFLLRRDQQ